MFNNPSEVTKYIEEEGVEFIDIRFCDLPGVMQHFNIPASTFDEEAIATGQLFDGSSIRGFQAIHESDMKLVPDLETAYLDPFRERKTLIVNFSIVDPFTDEPYSRDPRTVASKAEEYLKSTGIADTAFFAAEAEFYIFDDVRFKTSVNSGFYSIDSDEAVWNTDRDESEFGGNQGYKTRLKGGYFPVPPNDQMADLRDEIVSVLEDTGLQVERAHHEVGTAGQQEINYRFNTLLQAADDVMKFKYVVKNTVWDAGKTATFMPKPLFGDNGSGMHTHQSLWKDGEPLFFDERGYGGLSDIARWYIGGIIAHSPSLTAFTNPTVNSFKRLVPGFEAPVMLAYSASNRSASCRIPYVSNPKARRVEFRFPDPMNSGYLIFTALMMAGLDGIRNQIDPGGPSDKDLYDLPPEEAKGIPTVCHSLDQALEALDADREFLKAGGVMSDDFIDAYIALKMKEVTAFRGAVHPLEYQLYYAI